MIKKYELTVKNMYNLRIFIIVKNDCIQLRMPSTNPLPPDSNVRSKNRKHKRKRTKYDVYKKECYFYFYHPQSCPLSVSDCTYSHEKLSPCDNSAQ